MRVGEAARTWTVKKPTGCRRLPGKTLEPAGTIPFSFSVSLNTSPASQGKVFRGFTLRDSLKVCGDKWHKWR